MYSRMHIPDNLMKELEEALARFREDLVQSYVNSYELYEYKRWLTPHESNRSNGIDMYLDWVAHNRSTWMSPSHNIRIDLDFMRGCVDLSNVSDLDKVVDFIVQRMRSKSILAFKPLYWVMACRYWVDNHCQIQMSLSSNWEPISIVGNQNPSILAPITGIHLESIYVIHMRNRYASVCRSRDPTSDKGRYASVCSYRGELTISGESLRYVKHRRMKLYQYPTNICDHPRAELGQYNDQGDVMYNGIKIAHVDELKGLVNWYGSVWFAPIGDNLVVQCILPDGSRRFFVVKPEPPQHIPQSHPLSLYRLALRKVSIADRIDIRNRFLIPRV